MSRQAVVPPEQACALYLRRSSAQNKATNKSIAEQETECRQLAERQGLTIVKVFSEREGTGASARSKKPRPKWDAALAELDDGTEFRTIVAYHLDRADRRGAAILGALLDKHAGTGRRIIACDGTDTSDPNQRLPIIVRGEIAREEAERTGDRILRTKRYRREDGLHLGGPTPWGLRRGPDGRLEHDPATYTEARSVADRLLKGETMYSIVRDLNERRVSPVLSGKEWGSQQMRKVKGEDRDELSKPAVWSVSSLTTLVRSPQWAGLQGIRKTNDKGVYQRHSDIYRSAETGEPVSVGEGIVTPEERAIIINFIESRTQQGSGGAQGKKPWSGLLSNSLVCPGCQRRGASMSGSRGSRSYRCASNGISAGACENGMTCPERGLDDYVTSRVLIRLAELENDSEALQAAAHAWATELNPVAQAGRVAAEGALRAAEQELARVRRLAINGTLTEEEAAEEMPRLRAAVADAEANLHSLRVDTMQADWLTDLEYAASRWDDLDMTGQRRVIESLVDKIVVSKGHRGKPFRPYERVVIHWRGGATWPPEAAEAS